MEVSPEDIAKSGGGLLGAVAAVVMLFSTLRARWAGDGAQASASNAISETIEKLSAENARLHEYVEKLQSQVMELQTLLGEVSAKLERAEILAQQQATADNLARSGAIDRRRQR